MKELECEKVRTDWLAKIYIHKRPDGQPIELIEVKPEIRSAEYSMEDKWVQEYKAQFGTEPSFM